VSVVRWLLLIVLLIAAIPAVLFTIQNANWTAQLSLDLHVWATHLKAPMPVPQLMWISFGVGLLSGLVTLPVLKWVFGGESSTSADRYDNQNL
jgi:hypothetical protein